MPRHHAPGPLRPAAPPLGSTALDTAGQRHVPPARAGQQNLARGPFLSAHGMFDINFRKSKRETDGLAQALEIRSGQMTLKDVPFFHQNAMAGACPGSSKRRPSPGIFRSSYHTLQIKSPVKGCRIRFLELLGGGEARKRRLHFLPRPAGKPCAGGTIRAGINRLGALGAETGWAYPSLGCPGGVAGVGLHSDLPPWVGGEKCKSPKNQKREMQQRRRPSPTPKPRILPVSFEGNGGCSP